VRAAGHPAALSLAEALEVTRIYSVAGLLERKHLAVSALPAPARPRWPT
jgi:hypothetical protein